MENILHLKAPGDWINDPNGFIYYKGKYHLFYQYFPCAPIWGTMHWGHAVSEDLIHWQHLGIALYPTKEYDRNGIFSGSAIEINGKMHLYYTAVRYIHEDPDNIHGAIDGAIQSQAMICSEDGYTFDNREGKRQIISAIEDVSIGDPYDCRDPKVWTEDGKYFMCLASTHQKQEGVLLLFTSSDGEHWSYLNRLQDKRLGYILECPDLFEVDGQHILMSSPMGIMKGTDYPENQATLQSVTFDTTTGGVKLSGTSKFLDYGMDLYAPQSNLDSEGRRTVIAWVRMPVPQKAEDNEAADGRPWNGMMALPRLVTIRDGQICTPVHPAVRTYFSEGTCSAYKDGNGGSSWTRDGRKCVLTSITEEQTISVNGVKISLTDGCVCTDRSSCVPENAVLHTHCKTPQVGTVCELEIYAERNLIEIFINDGQYVISNVLYSQQ